MFSNGYCHWLPSNARGSDGWIYIILAGSDRCNMTMWWIPLDLTYWRTCGIGEVYKWMMRPAWYRQKYIRHIWLFKSISGAQLINKKRDLLIIRMMGWRNSCRLYTTHAAQWYHLKKCTTTTAATNWSLSFILKCMVSGYFNCLENKMPICFLVPICQWGGGEIERCNAVDCECVCALCRTPASGERFFFSFILSPHSPTLELSLSYSHNTYAIFHS